MTGGHMLRASIKYLLIFTSIYISVVILGQAANGILVGNDTEITNRVILTDDILFEISDIYLDDRLLLTGSVRTYIRDIDKIYIVIYRQNHTEMFERYYEAEFSEADETITVYSIINLPGYRNSKAVKMAVAIQEGNEIKLSSQKYYFFPNNNNKIEYLIPEETFDRRYKQNFVIY